jgi:hypothetical protein
MPIKPDPIVKEDPIDSPPKFDVEPEPKPLPKDIKVEPIVIVDMPPPQKDIVPIEDMPPPPKETIEPIGGGVILNTGGGVISIGGGGGGNFNTFEYNDFGTGSPKDFVGPREQQNME